MLKEKSLLLMMLLKKTQKNMKKMLTKKIYLQIQKNLKSSKETQFH